MRECGVYFQCIWHSIINLVYIHSQRNTHPISHPQMPLSPNIYDCSTIIYHTMQFLWEWLSYMFQQYIKLFVYLIINSKNLNHKKNINTHDLNQYIKFLQQICLSITKWHVLWGVHVRQCSSMSASVLAQPQITDMDGHQQTSTDTDRHQRT